MVGRPRSELARDAGRVRFVCASRISALVALVAVVAEVQTDHRVMLVESETVPEFVVRVATEPRLTWSLTSDGSALSGYVAEWEGMRCRWSRAGWPSNLSC